VVLALLHTLAVVVYLGGTVFLGAVLIPAVRRRGPEAEGLRIVAEAIRIFHPLSLASLGVLVLTGAGALTPLKETLGPEYVPRLFGVLALKLLLVFVLILVSSYQFFALGPRLFRALPAEGEKAGGGGSAEGMQLIQRLQWWSLVAIALGAGIVYLGLRMGRMGS
jgi:uncharacterized membrane protein